MPNLFLTDAESLQLKEIVMETEIKEKNRGTPEHISLAKIGIKLQKLCLTLSPRKKVRN